MAFDFNTFGTTPETSVKPETGAFKFSDFGKETTQPAEVEDLKTKGFMGKVADFFGAEKFARGGGTTISNLLGTQDKLIAVHNQNMAIQNNLVTRIKENKAKGKDTSMLEKVLNEQLKSNAELVNMISEVGTSNLSNKEVVGSALSTAALFAPGASKGSSLLTKMAVGGGTGYTMDVGNKLQDTNKTTKEAFKPGVGTIVGVSLPVISNIFGKLVSKTPAKLEQINQRLSPTEKKTLGSKGKEVAQYLVDNRVAGTPEQRLAKVNDLYTKMEDRIQGVINKTKVSYPKQEVITALDDVKGFFIDQPAEYQGISNKIDEITNFLNKNTGDQIPAGLMNDFKRSLANSAYNEKGSKVVSEGLKTASDVMYSFLQDTIPGLKPLNGEYSKIITAKGLLNSASTRSQIGLMEKGAAFLAGGSLGGVLGGPLAGSGGAFLGPKIANAVATPIRSGTAISLNEINKLISKIPTDKLGNLQLTKKALIQLLSK